MIGCHRTGCDCFSFSSGVVVVDDELVTSVARSACRRCLRSRGGVRTIQPADSDAPAPRLADIDKRRSSWAGQPWLRSESAWSCWRRSESVNRKSRKNGPRKAKATRIAASGCSSSIFLSLWAALEIQVNFLAQLFAHRRLQFVQVQEQTTWGELAPLPAATCSKQDCLIEW